MFISARARKFLICELRLEEYIFKRSKYSPGDFNALLDASVHGPPHPFRDARVAAQAAGRHAQCDAVGCGCGRSSDRGELSHMPEMMMRIVLKILAFYRTSVSLKPI